MVLPRPLILAIAGLALVLMSSLVVQRQRTVADTPAAPERASTAPAATKPDKAKTPRPTPRDRAGQGSRDANRSRDRKPETANRRPEATNRKPDTTNRKPAGAGRKPGASSRPAETGAPLETGVPAGVARALSQRKVIALLFTLEGAADDSATRSALRSLETGRKSKVAVFTDSIANVGRYSRLVGSLGISQVPSVVIVDTKREAQLLEGYVDSGTLRQYVADAKR